MVVKQPHIFSTHRNSIENYYTNKQIARISLDDTIESKYRKITKN